MATVIKPISFVSEKSSRIEVRRSVDGQLFSYRMKSRSKSRKTEWRSRSVCYLELQEKFFSLELSTLKLSRET